MSGGVVAGVPLQNDGGGAAKTGELAILRDAEIWSRASQHRAGHLFLNDGAETRPGGGEVAGDENNLGRERRCDETEAAAKMSCLASDGSDRVGVAFFRLAE